MTVLTDSELYALLSEDLPYGDLTTEGLGLDRTPASITFATRDRPLVAACIEEAVRLCELAGLEIDGYVRSGTMVPPSSAFFIAHGEIAAVQAVWKTVQNLLDYVSGIATHTRELVVLARKANPSVVVTTTRKTAPFTKKIAIKAVKAGGAIPHRLGLSETLLIFKEHRAFFGDETRLGETVNRLKAAHPEHKLVMEADDPAEAFAFAAMGADILQLEKFPVTELSGTVMGLKERYPALKLSATGGITRANIATYAASGVDIIVTSAPYSAPPADIKVTVTAGAR